VGRVEDRSQGGPATIVDTGDYCTSLISHVIDFYLNEMNQDGYIEDAVTKFRDSISSYQCPEESDSYLDLDDMFRLTMEDMGSIFLWHFVFVLMAFLFAVIKYYRRKKLLERSMAILMGSQSKK
jgi:hypothetical protein